MLEGGREMIMDLNIDSCTAIFAMRGRDSVVVCTEGRKLENLFGSVRIDNAIKFHWVHGNVYVAAGGVNAAVRRVLYLVRRSCNLLHIPEDVEYVAACFQRHANRVLLENDKLKCNFIVFGSLDAFSPVRTFKISTHIVQQNPRREMYGTESSDVLWAGSGMEYVHMYVLANIDEAIHLRNNGTQLQVRDFVRRAIYNARLNCFSCDGHIRAVSISESRGDWWPVQVVCETSRLILPRLYVPVAQLEEVYGEWVLDDFEPHRVDDYDD